MPFWALLLLISTAAVVTSGCGLFWPDSEEVTVDVVSWRGAGTWQGDPLAVVWSPERLEEYDSRSLARGFMDPNRDRVRLRATVPRDVCSTLEVRIVGVSAFVRELGRCGGFTLLLDWLDTTAVLRRGGH